MNKINLNENELRVLKELAEDYSVDGGPFFSFKPLASRTGLEISKVRLACRSLTRKGLAVFERALVDDEGIPAGAGYGATEKGAAVIFPCDVCGALATFAYDGKKECEAHYKQSTRQQVLPTSITV